MPELPEVETIVRGLRKSLVGRTFTEIICQWSNSVKPKVSIVKRNLQGKRILTLTRRGKYLKFHLSDHSFLFLHLKMSGDLSVEAISNPAHKHVRTTFRFDNNTELRFKDPRKFGRVFWAKQESEIVGHLGHEPLDSKLTSQKFCNLYKHRKGVLKALLLNQEIVVGIGNIYADESCFKAKIRPTRKANSLSEIEYERLWNCLRSVLKTAIKHRGSSFDEVYRGGGFQDHFSVYGRTGQSCKTCETTIKQTRVLQRSTHYCPHCQK